MKKTLNTLVCAPPVLPFCFGVYLDSDAGKR